MWKLGLWLRNSFSGNIWLEFSVLVLCSAVVFNFQVQKLGLKSLELNLQ